MKTLASFICFFAFCLLITLQAKAQDLQISYRDIYGKPCNESKAFYQSKVAKTDSGYFRSDYFVNNGRLHLAALYEDSACKTINGNALYLHANGNVQREVRMLHGKPEGIDISFHNNGLMSDSGFYANGQPVGVEMGWHYNGFIADSTMPYNDSVRTHISWFSNGTPAAAGREIRGKKTGNWTFFHHNGKPAARELYENGKAVTIHHYNEEGSEVDVDTTRYERKAVFKRGVKAWGQYLERALVWPQGIQLNTSNPVQLQVEMTIAEDGTIQDVYVLNPVHPSIDKVAYNAIRNGPAWEPAIQHNRTVPYRFRQVVTFVQ